MAQANANLSKSQQIAKLNDKLRMFLQGGEIMVSKTLEPLLSTDKDRIAFQNNLRNIRFTSCCDPEGLRDNGFFMFKNVKCYFQINYYDSTMQAESPDPSNPEITSRVMHICPAAELGRSDSCSAG